MRAARLIAVAVVASSMVFSGGARAQQIKSRVMVLLDTSGSMGFHFQDPVQFGNPCGNGTCVTADYPGGDGLTVYTDKNVANQFSFPGKLLGNNTRDGVNSRLYAAKASLSDAINAYSGDIDFGLSTYDFQMCTFASPLCSACTITCTFFGCSYTCVYADNGFTKLLNINWESQGCTGPGKGGRIIVNPGTGSGPKILPWIDGVEVFKDSGDGNASWGTGGGTPVNPELRAQGDTPLAEAINNVRTNWYDPIKNAANGNALYDPQFSCRPYVLVVETDGAQSVENCPGCCGADPTAATKALYTDNGVNPALTYVIGLSITNASDIAQLNNMAAAGGSGQARFANNQTDIEAAYADVLARSVKVEYCNAKDDNCNGLIDEGLGAYQECTTNAQCTSANCNGGRCACTTNAQCQAGYLCAASLCVPQCGVGVGACLKNGVKKCDPNNNTQSICCANDGQVACTPLVAGAPAVEICNGIDDNCNGLIDEGGVCAKAQCFPETCNGKDDDCDGIIDNNLIDTKKSCGYAIGICTPGTTVCQNSMAQDVSQNGVVADAKDALVCTGGQQPKAVQCNGCDNNCDGQIDAPQQGCYDGPMGTSGVGICHDGQQNCTATVCPQAAKYGPCVGEVVPVLEVCNGVDDDCNGKIDDVAGANVACCPSGKCGVGICAAGMMLCSGGALACVGGQGPQAEVCNGLDDDCNGKVDDLINVGTLCVAANHCPGTIQCDAMSKMETCVASVQNCQMNPCGNDPKVGKACGAGVGLPLPCMPGQYVCTNSMVTCMGGVGPMAEACNCKDDDCNGLVDDNAYCPNGYDCVNCGCYGKCGGGEFPCDGGYDPVMIKGVCYCLPNVTCDPACKVSEDCKQDPNDPTKGTCVDKCANVTCEAGYACQLGSCVDVSCVHNPSLCKACVNGAGGERCDVAQRACVPDLCCGNTCTADQFCEPDTGTCVNTCAKVTCAGTQLCTDGVCGDPKCKGVMCPESQLCDPASGGCVPNKCQDAACPAGLVCCAGTCKQDICALVQCPEGFRCSTSPIDCSHTCDRMITPTALQDRVVGAGGGGFAFGCAIGRRSAADPAHPSSSGTGSLPLLALGLLAALAVRRRR